MEVSIDTIDLGNSMFCDANEQVINWKGVNYYRGCDVMVKTYSNGEVAHCIKPAGHKSPDHEDHRGAIKSGSIALGG